jgi:O-antigen ligase
MLTSVTFGLYLGACLMCLWATSGRLRWPSRWVLPVLLSPLFLTSLYFSYTRSVWMGVAFGLLVILLLISQGRVRTLVATLACLALLMSVTDVNKLLSFKRDQESALDVKRSAEQRLSFAYVSWKIFQDYPLMGVGFGQFRQVKEPYLNDRTVDLPLYDIRRLIHHNTILSVLTETGLIGLGLFVAMLYGWGRHAWRLYRAEGSPPWARAQALLLLGVLVLYIQQLTFHELSYSTQDNCLVFLIAGMTLGIPVPRPAEARQVQEHAVTMPAPSANGQQLKVVSQ